MSIFKPKFSLFIILTFIVFTIVGTLSHELGHIAVAKILGYQTTLHYGSMSDNYEGYYEDEDVIEIFEIGEVFYDEINNNKPFEKKERFDALVNVLSARYPPRETDRFLIILGGPIQTMLVSCIGLLILWKRKSKTRKAFKLLDWLGIFLGLFILREVFNTMSVILPNFIYGTETIGGDEFYISTHLGMNQWTIPIITAVVGLLISVYIIFKIIPKSYQFTFVISGFFGGLLGFYIWFTILGPLVLP